MGREGVKVTSISRPSTQRHSSCTPVNTDGWMSVGIPLEVVTVTGEEVIWSNRCREGLPIVLRLCKCRERVHTKRFHCFRKSIRSGLPVLSIPF